MSFPSNIADVRCTAECIPSSPHSNTLLEFQFLCLDVSGLFLLSSSEQVLPVENFILTEAEGISSLPLRKLSSMATVYREHKSHLPCRDGESLEIRKELFFLRSVRGGAL